MLKASLLLLLLLSSQFLFVALKARNRNSVHVLQWRPRCRAAQQSLRVFGPCFSNPGSGLKRDGCRLTLGPPFVPLCYLRSCAALCCGTCAESRSVQTFPISCCCCFIHPLPPNLPFSHSPCGREQEVHPWRNWLYDPESSGFTEPLPSSPERVLDKGATLVKSTPNYSAQFQNIIIM